MTDIWTEKSMDEMLSCRFDDSQETMEAEPAAPANADQRSLLRKLEDPNAEKSSCFGGVLLSRTDANNKPLLSFVLKDVTEREVAKMEAQYDEIFRSGMSNMIYGANPFVEKFENYTVFNFLCNPSRISLNSYCRQGKKVAAQFMMRKLLKLLVERYDCSEEGYKSLNCISMDTVFVDMRGGIWLLPLQSFRNCFPRQIAPEAHNPDLVCDERSDLYATAYVSLEVENGGKLCDMQHLENGVFKDCLMGVPQCRPSLRRVAQLFNEPTQKTEKYTEQQAQPVPKQALSEKLRGQWQRVVQFFRKLLVFAEPRDEVSGTQNEYKKSIFRPIDPIRDADEECL